MFNARSNPEYTDSVSMCVSFYLFDGHNEVTCSRAGRLSFFSANEKQKSIAGIHMEKIKCLFVELTEGASLTATL